MLLYSNNILLKDKYTVINKSIINDIDPKEFDSLFGDAEIFKIKLFSHNLFPNGAKIYMPKGTWKYNTLHCFQNFSVKENFHLRDYQLDALNFIKRRNCGLIQAPTGTGKSFITIGLVNNYKCTTLIVTPTKKLLNEMYEKFKEFTNYVPGLWYSDKKLKKHITITTTTSFVKEINEGNNELKGFNMVIIDECDTKVSDSFINAICHCDCDILVGMTGTPKRPNLNCNDLELIYGPHVKIGEYQILPSRITQHVYQWSNYEIYCFGQNGDMNYNLYKSKIAMKNNYMRQNAISQLIKGIKNDSYLSLILLDTKDEVSKYSEIFKDALIITGETKVIDDEYGINKLKKTGGIIIGTRQKMSRGVDIPEIDNVIIASPVKFESTVIQSIGRALRKCNLKESVSIDIINDDSTVYCKQGDEQAKVCKKEYGITPKKVYFEAIGEDKKKTDNFLKNSIN